MSNPTIPIWIGSPTDIRAGDDALAALRGRNDRQFWNERDGQITVSRERWQDAQIFERQGWMVDWAAAASDRHDEHQSLFNDYRDVPRDLGRVLEVGCGPFTQLRSIFPGRTAESVTLQDPLIGSYLGHYACPYKGGLFMGRSVKLLDCPAEDLCPMHASDTIICINVLEHVRDARKTLDNLFGCLVEGGTLVFAERDHDDYHPDRLFDIGHPVRLRSLVLVDFMDRFESLVL
jgi:SAM-dependent methyltransferase